MRDKCFASKYPAEKVHLKTEASKVTRLAFSRGCNLIQVKRAGIGAFYRKDITRQSYGFHQSLRDGEILSFHILNGCDLQLVRDVSGPRYRGRALMRSIDQSNENPTAKEGFRRVVTARFGLQINSSSNRVLRRAASVRPSRALQKRGNLRYSCKRVPDRVLSVPPRTMVQSSHS